MVQDNFSNITNHVDGDSDLKTCVLDHFAAWSLKIIILSIAYQCVTLYFAYFHHVLLNAHVLALLLVTLGRECVANRTEWSDNNYCLIDKTILYFQWFTSKNTRLHVHPLVRTSGIMKKNLMKFGFLEDVVIFNFYVTKEPKRRGKNYYAYLGLQREKIILP